MFVCFFESTRSDREFLYEILGEVIKAGATTLNIPDTVGITVPNEFGKLIADIKSNTPGIENVIISTHCQNDLGLSTANTVAVSSLLSFALFIQGKMIKLHSCLISSSSGCMCRGEAAGSDNQWHW
jgi:hypothetical protein